MQSVAAAPFVIQQRVDSKIAMRIRVLCDQYIRHQHTLSFKRREEPQLDLTVSYMTSSKVL
jgi:hypothetical protein